MHSKHLNILYFIPASERNKALDKFIETVEDFPKTKAKPQLQPNLIKLESNAIKSLKSDDTIIIKEADKGEATIIMDKGHYQSMVESIFTDDNYYEKLATDPRKDTLKKYINFLYKYQKLKQEDHNGPISLT